MKILDAYFQCEKLLISRDPANKEIVVYLCKLSKGALKYTDLKKCTVCKSSNVWFRETKVIWHNEIVETD